MDELFDFEADFAQINVQVFQNIGGHAASFFNQPKQDVLGANVFVVKALRFLVGQLHDLAGAIGESFVHGSACFGLGGSGADPPCLILTLSPGVRILRPPVPAACQRLPRYLG